MSDWSGGYVSDIEYTAGFYVEQSPSLIDLTCLLNGVEPPLMPGREGASGERMRGEKTQGGPTFRYCELGCGQGLIANVLAAANPGAEIVAVDFNPAHIVRARSIAAEAGLANAEFIESAFEDLPRVLSGDGRRFDYVTLHGVYSWVSPATRRAIVDFLRDYVRPGGAVYISYNAMPGWSDGLPIQRLLKELAALGTERSDQSIRRAIGIAERMAAADSPYLKSRMFEAVRKTAERGEFTYLAHEYINASWHPMYHADVAAELADAKLTYVGAARLTENFPGLTLTAGQREILNETASPGIRETLKDYFWDRSFRKDVFVRGARRLPPARRDELLSAVRLALIVPRDKVSLQLEVPLGKADLEPRTYGPILDALAERPRTIGELLDLPNIRERVKPVEVAGLLVASGQVMPVPYAEPAQGGEPARRFNQVYAGLARFEELNRYVALAAPALGTGVATTVVELIIYSVLSANPAATPEQLAQAIWAPIAARGEKLLKDGQAIESETETLALLRERAAAVVENTIPEWRKLHVL